MKKSPNLGASLLLVFVLAKLAMIWGRAAPLTAWSVLGYLWQDVLVAAAFVALALMLRRDRIAWALYGALAVYAVINVPIGRVLSTPLTWPMLRAARGPLADSLLFYLTTTNIALVVAMLAAAASLPYLLRNIPQRPRRWAVFCALPIILVGPVATRRVDTRGMDRNAVTALLNTGLTRQTQPTGPPINWRESRFTAHSQAEDLSRFAGTAQNFNVVMVSLESTAAQYLSLYGGDYDVTPHLNRLARNALLFDNAYAVYPESIKGLFSVLCSTYPGFDTAPEIYQDVPCQSLAEVLGARNYRTGMFHSGRFDYLGMQSIIQHRGYQTMEDAGDIGGNHQSSFGVDEPATVTRMLSWIDALPRGQNFFLTYLPIAGHHPYATSQPGPFPSSPEISQYRNALHEGDESLGRLIDGLCARGLQDNTLWIIYGDHGEAFGQHPGNYGHTFFLYEENIHVPLLIAASGLLRNPERVAKVVSLVDIAPTILQLLRIPSPQNYQGRTMLDHAPRMALFFADYSLGLLGLRDGEWKYEYEIATDRSRLFNLQQDPAESKNLSSAEPARVSWYRQVVTDWAL